MGFANLPTLAEFSATRRAIPKHELRSRLDEKTASDKDDAKLLHQWARAVKARDGGKCRVCGVKTVTTLELDPKRGEAHHIRPRSCQATRTDVRNGLWVCLRCHQKLTRHQLFIVGTARQMFVAGDRKGKSYLNGDEALTFTEKRPEG